MKKYEYMTVDLSAEPSFNVHIKLERYIEKLNEYGKQGCRMKGAKTVFCDSLCGVRKCALNKGVSTCGDCRELETCSTVRGILENNPSALENSLG